LQLINSLLYRSGRINQCVLHGAPIVPQREAKVPALGWAGVGRYKALIFRDGTNSNFISQNI
jgi:hypothetical protein